MLKAGFDIHHIDGNHSNNAPANLVLIEHKDHMRLHGATRGFARELETVKQRRRELFLAEGKLAYETALEVYKTATYSSGIWIETGRKSGLGHTALGRARLWAKANDLEWPLFHSRKGRQNNLKAKGA